MMVQINECERNEYIIIIYVLIGVSYHDIKL